MSNIWQPNHKYVPGKTKPGRAIHTPQTLVETEDGKLAKYRATPKANVDVKDEKATIISTVSNRFN